MWWPRRTPGTCGSTSWSRPRTGTPRQGSTSWRPTRADPTATGVDVTRQSRCDANAGFVGTHRYAGSRGPAAAHVHSAGLGKVGLVLVAALGLRLTWSTLHVVTSTAWQ